MDKSLSVKIDDTIEGLLLFLLRFFATHGHIALKPYRSNILTGSLQKDPPPYTRPLTFLAIGAFLFSLLIDVYPAGFSGLMDLMWFGDEFKVNLSERWMEALTLTTLITTGLPVILTVSLLAGVSSRLLFKDETSRSYWFAINCYSFGYWITLLFILMSIDTLLSGVVILLPFLDGIVIPETISTPLLVLGLLTIVVLVIIVPLVLITNSYFELRELVTLRSKIIAFPFVLVYWLVGVYLIAQSASVVPDLTNTYFPKAVPEVMIFEEMKSEHHPDSDSVDIYFQVIVENKTQKDLLLELTHSQLSIDLSTGPGDPTIQSWPADNLILLSARNKLKTNRTIISKESNQLIDLKMTIFGWRDFYCQSYRLITENEQKISSGELDEAYQRLRLTFEPNFRLRIDRSVKIDRMIDHEELFSFYDDVVKNSPCVD